MGRLGAPRKVPITLAGASVPAPAAPRRRKTVAKDFLAQFEASGHLTWFAVGAARCYARHAIAIDHRASGDVRATHHPGRRDHGDAVDRAERLRAYVREQVGAQIESILYWSLVEHVTFALLAPKAGLTGWDANRQCAALFRQGCNDLARLYGTPKGRLLLGEMA